MIVLWNEAYEETRRLTKVRRRSVEVVPVECCERDKTCGCGGEGLSYRLVFTSCQHDAENEDGTCERESCRLMEIAKEAA